MKELLQTSANIYWLILLQKMNLFNNIKYMIQLNVVFLSKAVKFLSKIVFYLYNFWIIRNEIYINYDGIVIITLVSLVENN